MGGARSAYPARSSLRPGGEPTGAFGTPLADLLDELVAVERGEVRELLARLLYAVLDAQPVQGVPPRLLLGPCDLHQPPDRLLHFCLSG